VIRQFLLLTMSATSPPIDSNSWIVVPCRSYPYNPSHSTCRRVQRIHTSAISSLFHNDTDFRPNTLPFDSIISLISHPTRLDNYLWIVPSQGLLCTVFRCFDRDFFTFLGIHGGSANKTLVLNIPFWLSTRVGWIRAGVIRQFLLLTMSATSPPIDSNSWIVVPCRSYPYNPSHSTCRRVQRIHTSAISSLFHNDH
jgi:hypothetical protein